MHWQEAKRNVDFSIELYAFKKTPGLTGFSEILISRRMALIRRGVQKKSRFTEEKMVTILHEADRTKVAEAAKKHKVSEASMYAWRKHFGPMEAF